MKYGFVLPYGDAQIAANLAFEAEQAGWDGFFVWEPVWGIDAWISLTAAAMVPIIDAINATNQNRISNTVIELRAL